MQDITLWEVVSELEDKNRSYAAIKPYLGKDTLGTLYKIGKKHFHHTRIPFLSKEGVTLACGFFVLWLKNSNLPPDIPVKENGKLFASLIEKNFSGNEKKLIPSSLDSTIFTNCSFSDITRIPVDLALVSKKENQKRSYYIMRNTKNGVLFVDDNTLSFLEAVLHFYKKEKTQIGFLPCLYTKSGNYIGKQMAWLWGDSFTLLFSGLFPNSLLLPYCQNKVTAESLQPTLSEDYFLTNITPN